MTARSRRRLRRFLRRAGWPLAYAASLAACLGLFLASMHSCSRDENPTPSSGVQIITNSRN